MKSPAAKSATCPATEPNRSLELVVRPRAELAAIDRTSDLTACHAGVSPVRSPSLRQTPIVNTRTRHSSGTDTSTGMGKCANNASKRRVMTRATPRPNAALATDRTSVSVTLAPVARERPNAVLAEPDPLRFDMRTVRLLSKRKGFRS